MEEKIRALLEKTINDLGFILYDVEYQKEDENWILRIMIDTDNGKISLDDCVMVSEAINPILDKEDPIENEYMLEVCSAGAEKPLRNIQEYKKALNEYVYVKIGNEEYTGYLEEVNENNLVVKINLKGRIKKVVIDIDKIESARLAIKF